MMKKIILSVITISVLLLFAHAYSAETATVHAHYAHPISGLIEDAGNNPGIGQGMVENVAHNVALFEEVDGQWYACVRLNMMDYISDVNFSSQARAGDDFYALDYQVVQESTETTDYRFAVPSKEAIIRVSGYVDPMERQVIFYMSFSDFAAGNADFIAMGESGQLQNVVKSSSGDATGKIELQGAGNLMSAGQLGYDHGLLMKDSPQIKALFAAENSEQNTSQSIQNGALPSTAETARPWGPLTTILVNGLVLLLVLLTFFFVVLAIVLLALARYLKARNDIEQEALYEKD